jgi:hypothetical protein
VFYIACVYYDANTVLFHFLSNNAYINHMFIVCPCNAFFYYTVANSMNIFYFCQQFDNYELKSVSYFLICCVAMFADTLKFC